MKQIIVKVTMLLAVLIMSAKAFAYDFEVDGIYYNILSDTTCEVTYKSLGSRNDYIGKVIIPKQVSKYHVGTKRVVAIGACAFALCPSLSSIDIPNSVKEIGNSAFSNCTGLKSIIIPDSVESIGIFAFDWCRSLTSVDIPNSIKSIGPYAFRNCTGLTSVDIPHSIEYINEGTFEYCI